MKISNDFHRYEAARQIYSVLVMHFQEGITQSEIARITKLSHAKVNRLIKQGREMGMVEINIRSPYQALFDLEGRLKAATGLETVRITPTASQNPQTILKQVGAAAASLLLETLKDGDTVCITGGKGLSAVVDMLESQPRLRCRGRAGDRSGAGKALHRRQPCRDPDGRAARRQGLPHPCSAVCRQRRRAAHADEDEVGGRRVRPRPQGEDRRARHRIDPVRRLRATTTCTPPRAATARRSRRRARPGNFWLTSSTATATSATTSSIPGWSP